MDDSGFNRLFESEDERAAETTTTPATAPEIIEMGETPTPAEEPTPVPEKRKAGKVKRFMRWTLAIITLVGALTIYLYYFNPYVVDAQKSGYISSVEKKGIIFKTYEGVLVEQASVTGDSNNFNFTFESDSLATKAMDIQGSGERVKVKYRKYNSTIPWRGDSEYVVFDVQKPQ